MPAPDLERQCRKQREIATALGVTEAAVSQCLATARCGGPEPLRSHPGPGLIPRLTEEDFSMQSSISPDRATAMESP
jgi:hypothetical protein